MAPDGRSRWVAIELEFCDNPKILKVGAAGGWAHLRAIVYAARHRTDGFIPAEEAWRIVHDDPTINQADAEANQGLVASMVEANLWHPVEGGYRIHDYLAHQSSSESISEKRARAGRLGGLKSGEARRSRVKQTKQTKLEVEVEVDKGSLFASPGVVDLQARAGLKAVSDEERRQNARLLRSWMAQAD